MSRDTDLPEQLTDEEFDPFDDVYLGTKPTDPPPYLGIIFKDAWEQSILGENHDVVTQWVYAVRPVDLRAKAFYGFLKKSMTNGSVFMKANEAFAKVFGTKNKDTGEKLRFGKGDLIGYVAWFQNKSFSYGPNINPSKPAPIPVRAATAEEWERAQNLPEYETQATGDDAEDRVTPASFNADEVELLIELYEGRTQTQALKEAIGSSNLPENLVAAVRSGAALTHLKAEGLIEVGEDKLLHAKVPA